MSDLIGREALLEKMNKRLDDLRKKHGQYDHYTDGFDDAVDMVMDFPAAEAEPVRHGRWIFGGDGCVVCSECDEEEPNNIHRNYCPNCGAKMDGGLPHNVGQATGGAEDA